MEEKNETIFKFELNDESRVNIKGLSQWAIINAILGFISAGMSVVMFIVQSNTYKYSRSPIFGFSPSNSPAGLIIGMGISLTMNILLYNTSVQLKKALESNNQGELSRGFNSLHNYLKVFGILMIVFTILMILVAIFVSSFRRY